MATNKKWDQLLTQALQKDLDTKMAMFSTENEVGFTFSEEFEADMQKLLSRASKPYYYFINTIGKRAAVIAVVLFIALTTTVFSVEAFRKPVVEFFVKIFEQFSMVVFGAESTDGKISISSDDFYVPAFVNSDSSSKSTSGISSDNTSSKLHTESSNTNSNKASSEADMGSVVTSRHTESRFQNTSSHASTSQTPNSSRTLDESSQPISSRPQTSSDLPVSSEQEPELNFPKIIETIRKPEIPDGYELDYEEKVDGSYYIELVNREGNFFTFEQYVITTLKITVDTENVSLINLTINGFEAVYYENKGYGNLLWTDGEYGYTIIGTSDQELLRTIAESVK